MGRRRETKAAKLAAKKAAGKPNGLSNYAQKGKPYDYSKLEKGLPPRPFRIGRSGTVSPGPAYTPRKRK